MPLNTYVEPTVGTSLNAARLQQNDNFRSLLTNFAGATAPTSSNLTVAGSSFAIPDGMFYRDTTTGTLFISDSTHKQGSYVGGNFTRWGIGSRNVATLTDIYTNRSKYERGELIGVLDSGTLYIRKDNADANASFVQIGAVSAYTVESGTSNVAFIGGRVEASKFYATTNIMIGTTTASNSLHVIGTSYISGNVTLGSNTTVANKLGVATTAPTANLHVVGNTYISTEVSIGGNVVASGNITAYSDVRLKTDIKTIDNALDKLMQLRGVSFTKNGTASIGVIAQELEQVLPEVVLDGEYKSVAYGNIVGLLIEAIKELKSEVDLLKKGA